MRTAFVTALTRLAAEDERVVLLTGDLGFMVLEEFAESYPDRFYNAGVAEQNMVGMATGLAEAGFTPYVYSIATFASMRGYEFVRNGPVLHNLPVRIVGVGGGFDYSTNGVTHYALEDVAIMRAQPGLRIAAPADPAHAATALAAGAAHDGPVYFRLGKRREAVPGLHEPFAWGRMPVLGDGEDVAIIALGTMSSEALAAAEILARQDIKASVGVLASVAPPPVEDILALASRSRLVVTVEAHYGGGAGSLVAEVLADAGLGVRLVRLLVDRVPRGRTGSYEFMLREFGLSAEQIAEACAQRLGVTPV
jgi:transketolase